MDESGTEDTVVKTMCRLGRVFVQGESIGSVGVIKKDGIQEVGKRGL